jgi:hypothetical protein
MYDHSAMIDLPFISGHYARNPIIENYDNLDVFSIVRDPVEHYVSVAAYVCFGNRDKMSNEYMDEYLYGNITPFGYKEMFGNSGNLQSKMLFCRIVLMDKSVVALRDADCQNENIIFIENDMPNQEDIKMLIKTMNVFSFTDRGNAIHWLKEKISNSHSLVLDESIHNITNSMPRNEFKPDISHIREIRRRSQVDEYLYKMVLEK